VSAQLAIGVAALGALGALSRYLVHELVFALAGWTFPWGTLVINLSGSFALGVLVGATASTDVQRLLGTGFLGGYTTFSTWMLDTRHLGERHRAAFGLANVVGSLIAGVLLAWLGRSLA
jgi:CrcB protein